MSRIKAILNQSLNIAYKYENNDANNKFTFFDSYKYHIQQIK